MSVIIEKQAPLFTVIINRPDQKNAVNRETADALAAAFREFDNDDTYSVAILCGADNTFCAGADLKSFAHQEPNRLEPDGDGPMGPSRMLLSKPVIAAIAGHAVAGGLELALWCDMRVVEETAVMGVFCRRFGVPLIDGGTIRLPRLIGMSHAMDLILTGRAVDAHEAKQIGLANRVVPHGTAKQAAQELALQIAAFPQNCLRSDRLSSYEQWNMSLEDALSNEFERGMEPIEKGETLKGATQFSTGKGKHGTF